MKYPKFKSKEECAFPNRDDCNYGEGYNRCPYMKYNNSKSIFDSTRWECRFNKNEFKDFNNCSTLKESIREKEKE